MASTGATNMEFIGPANELFDSFMDQSKSYLAYHCPGWNDHEHPTSYLMPPRFRFKHPEKSDTEFEESLEKLRKKKENTKLAGGGQPSSKSDPDDRFVIDRLSCTAEHVVYESINKIIQDKVSAPFIALHDFDINKQGQILRQILLEPEQFSQTAKKLRQYDFVLIGPKIGFVVIEVKSSKFDNSRTFKNKHLPDQYSEGIDQLNSIDALLSGLGKGFRLDPSKDIPIRKILFTQNLERERYSKWMEQLQPDVRLPVIGKIGQIIQWFKEDMTNSGKHGLYLKLRSFLEEPHAISKELYETYAPILAGINSVIIQRGQTRKVEFDEDRISFAQSVRSESWRVETQNPKGIFKGKDLPDSKVILLTPKQKAILESTCPRLFIVGAAGVGKTIILQQKALEWMEDGQSVLVFVRESYITNPEEITSPNDETLINKYTNLFEAHGFKAKSNFQVESWNSCFSSLYDWKPDYDLFKTLSRTGGDLFDCVYDIIQKREEPNSINYFELFDKWYLNDILKFDHILVDDAFDETDSAWKFRCLSIPSLAMMAFAHKKKLKGSMWIAVDPYGHLATIRKDRFTDSSIRQNQRYIITEVARLFKPLLSATHEPLKKPCREKSYCSVILQDVMRCPQSVFSIAYDMKSIKTAHIPPELIPRLGHKIQGLPNKIIQIKLGHEEDGFEKVRIHLEEVLKYFFSQARVPASHIAIINDIFDSRDIEKYFQEAVDDKNFEQWRNEVCMCFPSGVSSLEWPIVIYIQNDFDCMSGNSCMYRMRSRATAQLILIIVDKDYNEPTTKKSAPCPNLRRFTIGDVAPLSSFQKHRLAPIFKRGETWRKKLKVFP